MLDFNSGILLYIGAGYATAVTTWFFYVAAMHLMQHRKNLHIVAKIHAYPFVFVGIILDAILNLVFATVFLLDLPKEFLLTQRLQRLKKGSGWRKKVAYWLCKHLLNQFDPGHC